MTAANSPSGSSALTEAHGLIYGERAAQYGTTSQNFEDTARLWSVVLGIEVNAYQVLLCLAQLKIARAVCNLRAGEVPKHDTVVDIAGYAGLIEKLERGQ